MKHIQLTQGKKVVVDDKEYDNLVMFKWCYDKGTGYAVRNTYPIDWKHPVKQYMHRVIIKAPKNNYLVTDHINRNRLDNRLENLRIVDRRTNILNSPKFTKVNA